MPQAVLSHLSNYTLPAVVTALVSYLLGSISFSIIFTKLFDKKDIRTMGSGNAGATNVLRSVGKVPAILTFIGDFGKGVLAIVIGKMIFMTFSVYHTVPFTIQQYGAYIAGFSSILGHIYPLYFKFKGGKGVLTTAAMMLLIDYRVFLILGIVFLIVFVSTRIVSLSSIIAAGGYPIATFIITYFLDYKHNLGVPNSDFTLNYVIIATLVTALIGGLVVIKHKENIKRILAGTEKKIRSKD